MLWPPHKGIDVSPRLLTYGSHRIHGIANFFPGTTEGPA
jgi:hypothetical protein